ncbi:MAG: hypothetical protein WC497_03090 [Patescibacteria group bacterium]
MKLRYLFAFATISLFMLIRPLAVRAATATTTTTLADSSTERQAEIESDDEKEVDEAPEVAPTPSTIQPVEPDAPVATAPVIIPTPTVETAPATPTQPKTVATPSADQVPTAETAPNNTAAPLTEPPTDAAPAITPQAANSPLSWTWIATRAAGIASFLLLAVITITGISLTTGLLFRLMSPASAWSMHRAIGSALLVSIIIHIGALPFDRFIRLRVVDLLVPFASSYRPTLVALGIFGFYLLLLVLGTSLYTLTSHARFWRTVHFFGFPMFVMIFLHSVLIGSDSKQPWMIAMYWSTAVLVSLFVVYRLAWKYRKPALANYAD